MIIGGERKQLLVKHILGPEEGEKQEEGSDALHSCVEEFLDAVHSHDVKGAAQALKACFAHFDSEPHHEGPHTEE